MEALAIDVVVFVGHNWQAFFAVGILAVAAGVGALIWRM